MFNIAEGINLRKVLVSFGYRVSFKEAMKYAYIGYFFSSVTPSATGGQPLQLYAMSKDKIHVAHGTMALLTELTSFQIAAFLMENVATFWILTGRIRLNKDDAGIGGSRVSDESDFYSSTGGHNVIRRSEKEDCKWNTFPDHETPVWE